MRTAVVIVTFLLTIMALTTPASAEYPYWDEGAHTNEAQADRLNLLRSERDERRDKLKQVRVRIRVLKARKHRLKQSIGAHSLLLRFVKTATGLVEWLYPLRLCESTNNYQAVSATGRYRGAYQFDSGAWANAYGYSDPIDAPWYVQDARTAEVRRVRGTSPWPHCG